MRFTPVVWILLLSSAAAAQTPAPNGIVTGRVFCGDTGLPCRFAQVSLRPVIEPPKQSAVTTSATPSTLVNTSIDGTYAIDQVAPGRYYVIVYKDGYIEPSILFTREQLKDPSPQMRALVKQALHEVNVEQNATAHADIQIQRGATISGTVACDDGAPASDVNIKVMRKDKNGGWISAFVRSLYTTDDRGHYRITALLPDTYLIVSTLNFTSTKVYYNSNDLPVFDQHSQSTVSFYGDGKAHIDDATPITVRGDEERSGTDIIIPLNKLHKLTGRVAIEPGNHFANAASIELLYGDQKTVIASDIVSRDNGLFHFEFVPEGNYTLRVTNARDVTWEPPDPKANASSIYNVQRPDRERTLQTYGDAEMPLTLQGDMLDVIATVKPQQPKTAVTN